MSYADEIYQSEIAQGTDPETARSNAYLLSQQPEVDAWSERYLRENPEFAQSLKPGWFSQAEWKSIDLESIGMATKFRMKSKSLKPKKAPTKPKPKKRPDPPKSSGPP